MKEITLEMVRDEWDACYEGEELAKLFDSPKTAIEVLSLEDGQWKSVPPEDRLWVVLREDLVSAKTLRLFACWCAEQALTLIGEPDPRSVAAVEVARRFANGEATRDELDAASAAARDAARAASAAAWDAASAATWDATWDAAWAARATASAAANAAAWDAARAARDAANAAESAAANAATWDAAWDTQVQTLIQMIGQENAAL